MCRASWRRFKSVVTVSPACHALQNPSPRQMVYRPRKLLQEIYVVGAPVHSGQCAALPQQKYRIHPPSIIFAASRRRIATSSPTSRHLTAPLRVLRQAGTNSGVTPNAAQNAARDAAVRLGLSNVAAAVLINETTAPADVSTAARRVAGGIDIWSRFSTLACSVSLQVRLPTRVPVGVQRPAGTLASPSASHSASASRLLSVRLDIRSSSSASSSRSPLNINFPLQQPA